MSKNNRVHASLLEGMRDLLNLLVHLQTVLKECGLPVVRAGGGLTFSGFSIQVAPGAPVDWVGHHIDRPSFVIYRIQDRVLPKDCPLTHLNRLQARQYERLFHIERSFFELDEDTQMSQLRQFVQETVDYLRGLPPEEEDSTQPPFIPIISQD